MNPQYDEGGVTLYQGDALRLLAAMPSGSVDAIITDPPYSSGGAFRGDRTALTTAKYLRSGAATELRVPSFEGDNRDQRAFASWCYLWLSDALRVAREGAILGIFTDWRQLPTMTDALQAGGWVWRGIVVWDKTGAARPCLGRFTAQCEYLLWGSRGPLPLNRPVPVLPGVYRHPAPRGADRVHVTSKPLGLMRDLLRIVVPGGTVLDPFAGGGATLLAAREVGLSAIGCEIMPAYADLIERRLRESPN